MLGMFTDEASLDPASGVPLYFQLKERIERRIDTGAFPAGSMLPAEKELVAHFQVSRHTVRRAYQILADQGRVVPLRGKGTFVARNRGRGAAVETNAQPSIAILLPDIHEGTLPILVQHVISTAFDLGFATTVCSTEVSLKKAKQHIGNAARLKVSGVVFLPLGALPYDEVNLQLCEYLKQNNLPFVVMDRPLSNVDSPFVASDNLEGGRVVGRYLRSMGHERILVVVDGANSSIEDRVNGLKEYMDREPALVHYYPDIESDFEQKIKAALDGPERPTAVFAVHDLVARRVLDFLHLLEIDVPEKISLVGFDDLPFCKFLQVPLTTVRQSFDSMARESVELLVGLVRDAEMESRKVRLPVRLVERASVKKI